MNNCELCGGNNEALVEIADCWKTEKIKKVCWDCEKILNECMRRSEKYAEDQAKLAYAKIHALRIRKSIRDFFNSRWKFAVKGKQDFMTAIDLMAKPGGK